MNAPDNIARLEHRALRIEEAMDLRDRSDRDWREGTLKLAIELAGARADHGDNDRAFGEWLSKRFGARAPAATNRAVLVRWGQDPDQARALLEKTDSRSLQGIDQMFSSVRKQKRGRPPRHNKVEATAEALKEETGELPTPTELAHAAGVHRRNADNALRVARAVEEAVAESEAKAEAAEAALIASVKFTKAQDHHVEVVVRRHLKEVEKERKAWLAKFWEQVTQKANESCEKRFPHLQERENAAFRKEEYWQNMINKHKPIFTEQEFSDIRMCLHPDNSASKEKREHAFHTFNIMKLQLTGKK